MQSAQRNDIVPRSLTTDEIAFLRRNDWVKLNAFIGKDEAASLLSHLTDAYGRDADKVAPSRRGEDYTPWRGTSPLSVDINGRVIDDRFFNLSHHPTMARIGEQVTGGPVRYLVDGILVKSVHPNPGSDQTNWHRDQGVGPACLFETTSSLYTIWVALKETPARSGTMRFVPSRFLTSEVLELADRAPLEDTYQEFQRRGIISAEVDYEAGDATLHLTYALHSAPPNRGAEARWGFYMTYFPAGATYSGYYIPWIPDHMKPGSAFDSTRFAIIT